jgi:hypothetical protein
MNAGRLPVGVMAVLLLLTFASSATGSINGEKDESAGEKSATSSAKPSTEEQLLLLNEKVQKLEEMVERQQRIIESLQPKPAGELKSAETGAAAVASPAAANVAAPTDPSLADDQIKKLDTLYKSFGQLKISGDLRFRNESFINQGFDSPLSAPDRNRMRIRARLQIAGQLHKNFDWGIRLSTGNLTEPTSTNQTLTDFFNRKPVGFDRYFIRYDSKTDPAGIILQAGKFDYPWRRTELTFDNDLQPEGAAETVYFKGKGVLKDVRLIAFQLQFNEVSAGKDAYLLGGQLQSTVTSGHWSFTGSATLLNFNRADAIARALGRPSTQVGGGLDLSSTNRLRRDAAGNVTGFVANFNILDLIGNVTYNGFKKYPVNFLYNYARNMSDRLENLGERDAYWAEIQVGRLKEKGDIRFGYTFIRIEQDAVISPLNYSDILNTNSRNSRINFGYAINSNVFLEFTGFFTQRFNTLPDRENRLLKRFQFDANYQF